MAKPFSRMSKTMKFVRIFAISVMLIYSGASLGLAINTYNQLQQNILIVQETIQNWKLGAISDFQIAINGTCPPPLEAAYKYDWAGTDEGCDCRPANASEFRALGLHSKSCNSTELQNGCYSVNGYGARDLTTWGSYGPDLSNFCIQRSNDTWATIGPTQGKTCPSGKIKCGTSPDNVFCTSDSICPITSISITSVPCATCLSFDGNGNTSRYINITRGEDKLPLVEFRLNEDGMCYLSNRKSRTHGRDYYFLYSGKTYDCNKEGNGLWNIIDTKTEAELFSYNLDMTTIANYLSKYGYYSTGFTGSNVYWSIFSRGYVPWKLNCRSVMGEIIEEAKSLEGVRLAHLAMLGVTILSTIIVGIVLTAMELLNLCGYDLPCIQGKEEEERTKLLRIKSKLQCAAKIILLPFQIWAIMVLFKTKGLVGYASDNDCSSPIMNNLIDEASSSLKNAFKSDIAAIAVLVVFLIISLLQARSEKKMLNKAKQSTAPQPYLLKTDGTVPTYPDESSVDHSEIPMQPSSENQVTTFNQGPLVLGQSVERQNGPIQTQMPSLQIQFQPSPIQMPGIQNFQRPTQGQGQIFISMGGGPRNINPGLDNNPQRERLW